MQGAFFFFQKTPAAFSLALAHTVASGSGASKKELTEVR
jgi:hypothetical protein